MLPGRQISHAATGASHAVRELLGVVLRRWPALLLLLLLLPAALLGSLLPLGNKLLLLLLDVSGHLLPLLHNLPPQLRFMMRTVAIAHE